MKAGPVVVGQLLQGKYRYCVPIYQRHFVWNREKQWEPFWNDIRTKAIERLAGRQWRFMHFMGAIVLEPRGGFSVRHPPAFQVVDGQQRLMVFQLFLAAARDYATVIGYTSAAQTIETYLLNGEPKLMENPEVEIYKVWPTQYDREMFIDIINLGGREALREKYPQHFFISQDRIKNDRNTPKLIAAYGYFYDRIRHSVETDDLDDAFYAAATTPHELSPASEPVRDVPKELRLDATWQSLVEEFRVVEITLEEGDDAQVIYETLNQRGEPLLAADLVRNNIFQRADAAGESAERLFDGYWKLFEDESWLQEERQGRYRKPRIEFFLANYIAGKIAGEVNLTKLFSEYKSFVQYRSFPSVASELKELNHFGSIYMELVNRTGDSALARFGRDLAPWDVTTVFPLALRLWNETTLDVADKATCLRLLLSFVVRRAVCGLTTKNYNKFFLSVVGNLDRQGWDKSHFTRFLLAQTSDINRFPPDDEFERRWIESPIYSMLPVVRTRALLEELETAKRGPYTEPISLSGHLTIEHVLPAEWGMHWPLGDGAIPTNEDMNRARYYPAEDDTLLGRIVHRNRLKNTIGNLTLVTRPLNSSISNGPFEVKRDALMEYSGLVLNREITHQTHWDEDQIEARSQNLFALAKTLWPAPQPTGDGEVR